jgi:hypothetical protein
MDLWEGVEKAGGYGIERKIPEMGCGAERRRILGDGLGKEIEEKSKAPQHTNRVWATPQRLTTCHPPEQNDSMRKR